MCLLKLGRAEEEEGTDQGVDVSNVENFFCFVVLVWEANYFSVLDLADTCKLFEANRN